MNFRKLVPGDQSIFNQYLKNINNFQTDFSVATILLFEEFKNPEISITEKCIFIKGYMNEEEIFFSPLCKLDYFNESMEKIILYFKQKNKPYKILYIQKDYIKEFLNYKKIKADEKFYENNDVYIKENQFIVFNDRNDAEYIYLPKNLIDLQGNKYRKIREKINKFNKEYKNKYEIIEYNNSTKLDDLINIVNYWNKEKNITNSNEANILKYILENIAKLDINVFLLKINETISGISIIQVLPNNVGVIIYEKSLQKIQNANYILNFFGANKLKNCKGISRQEDIGIEGLRQAKLSYRPFYLEKKFNLYYYNEKDFLKLYKYIFNNRYKIINSIKYSNSGGLKHCFFIFEKEKNILNKFNKSEKKLKFFNQIEDVPFIFGLEILIEEKINFNFIESEFKNLIKQLYSEKYNIAIIYSDKEELIKFYEKFGFIKFNRIKRIYTENLFKKNFDVKIGNINNTEEINNIFNNYYEKAFNILQYRNLEITKEKLKDTFHNDGKLLIFSINNINYGYLIYEQGLITEYISLLNNEENEEIQKTKEIIKNKKLDYILECKSINVDEPIVENLSKNEYSYILMRLINPQNFIKKYLDQIYINNKVEFNKNIIVKDDIIGNSVYNVKNINNKNYFTTITNNNAVNIEISISELMKNIISKFKVNLDFNIQEKNF